MKHTLMILAAAGMFAGCSPEMASTSRVLGDVSYGQAFAAGKQVMSNFFPVASANLHSGVITSRPKPITLRSERLVTGLVLVGMAGSPARRIATLKLRRSRGSVIAFASVEIQRQDSAVHRQRGADLENYDSVPNMTPADLEAASSPGQNEMWRTCRHDRAMEERILSAVYAALNPARK